LIKENIDCWYEILISLDNGVIDFIKEEAKKAGIAKPVLLIMDCGCIMNQETVELDIKEKGSEEGYEFYMKKEGVEFYVNPKVRHLADKGRISVVPYGANRFRRLDFNPLDPTANP
jgi:hypothetical protein